MKKAPAAATMATKPWPTANTLAAPLKLDAEGEAELIGLVTAGVVTTPGAVPVAGAEELPATGNGVVDTDETAAVVAGAEVAGVVTTALELLALAVVETWLSVLSPGADTNEVGAEATEPVATQGKVEM